MTAVRAEAVETRCTVPGCDEWYIGSGDGGRTWLGLHIVDAHGLAAAEHVDEEVVMGSASPSGDPVRDSAAVSSEPPFGMARRGRGYAWTFEGVAAAVRYFHRQHGRPPTHSDIKNATPWLPAVSTLARLPFTLADAVEAAGFPRPTKQTRYDAGVAQPVERDEPAGEEPPATSVEAAGSTPASCFQDSSGEGAVTDSEPRGHARPGDEREPDAQAPDTRAPAPGPPLPPGGASLETRAAALELLAAARRLVDAVWPEPE